MKKYLLMAICLFSVAAVAKVEPQPTRKVASTVDESRNALANAYHALAIELAIARESDFACNLNAYSGDVMSAIARALDLEFDKSKIDPAIERHLATNAGFRYLLSRAEVSKQTFENTILYSNDGGIFGPDLVHLKSGGVLEVKRKYWDESKQEMGWASLTGTWSFRPAPTTMKSPSLIFNFGKKAIPGGTKTKIETYRIIPTVIEMGGLMLVKGTDASRLTHTMYHIDSYAGTYYASNGSECGD